MKHIFRLIVGFAILHGIMFLTIYFSMVSGWSVLPMFAILSYLIGKGMVK